MTQNAVQTAWQANWRVNEVLLEHLTSDMLDARTPGGGYSVAQQLAHLVGTTQYWGWLRDKARFEALPDPVLERDEAKGVFVVETDLAKLAESYRQTQATALDVARAEAEETGLPPGEWESPHATPDAFLIHMMIHDAHHRGQILLALKTAGHPLPDEDLMWGPWRGE